MKVILKNDEGNHFRIDSKRGRERRIVYGLMRRTLQRCGRFSLFFLWDQKEYALPFCKKTQERELTCERALAKALANSFIPGTLFVLVLGLAD